MHNSCDPSMHPDKPDQIDGSRASQWLVTAAAVSVFLAFVSLSMLLWAKWGLVTFMKSNFWLGCF